VFEHLFRESGLPLVIRTNNGCPFGTLAILRLSWLAI